MFKIYVESNVLFHVRREYKSLPQLFFCKVSLFEPRLPRFELKNESYFFEQSRLLSTV